MGESGWGESPPPWAYSAEVAFGYEGWKGEVETAGNSRASRVGGI